MANFFSHEIENDQNLTDEMVDQLNNDWENFNNDDRVLIAQNLHLPKDIAEYIVVNGPVQTYDQFGEQIHMSRNTFLNSVILAVARQEIIRDRDARIAARIASINNRSNDNNNYNNYSSNNDDNDYNNNDYVEQGGKRNKKSKRRSKKSKRSRRSRRNKKSRRNRR